MQAKVGRMYGQYLDVSPSPRELLVSVAPNKVNSARYSLDGIPVPKPFHTKSPNGLERRHPPAPLPRTKSLLWGE